MFFGVVLAGSLGLQAQGESLVLPLLATQLLWINLLSDGAPALALGIDPPDEALMTRPPRPRRERVITGRMWGGIFLVGTTTAAATLFALDASLPGGFVQGTGTMRYAQTMAFTTLSLAQVFNALNARSEDRSAFKGLFTNGWLWASLGLSVLLQAAVVYLPFLQRAFSTQALGASDWLRCAVIASSTLVVREISKLAVRASRRLGQHRARRPKRSNDVSRPLVTGQPRRAR